MSKILKEDTHVRQRLGSHQLLLHIRIESELLHVLVGANSHKALAAVVARIPEALHNVEHPEHLAVIPQKAPPRLGHVAEGVYSAPTVLARATSLGVEMPITEEVVGVLDGRLDPLQAMVQLMTRDARSE